jgi:hypothetical protein
MRLLLSRLSLIELDIHQELFGKEITLTGLVFEKGHSSICSSMDEKWGAKDLPGLMFSLNAL